MQENRARTVYALFGLSIKPLSPPCATKERNPRIRNELINLSQGEFLNHIILKSIFMCLLCLAKRGHGYKLAQFFVLSTNRTYHIRDKVCYLFARVYMLWVFFPLWIPLRMLNTLLGIPSQSNPHVERSWVIKIAFYKPFIIHYIKTLLMRIYCVKGLCTFFTRLSERLSRITHTRGAF